MGHLTAHLILVFGDVHARLAESRHSGLIGEAIGAHLQMGVNFLDSQAGKTGFGMPRMTYTPFIDDTHEELPADILRRPDVPFWSGAKEVEFASQVGMTCFGTPRDVRGEYVRRLW